MRSSFRPLARVQTPGLVFLVVLSGAVSAGIWKFAAADLDRPQATDRQVALLVSSLMRRDHFSKHSLDDQISERSLSMFLKNLDPMKVYFLQSDVEEFKRQKHELDDMIKKGDISFAYTVYKRLLQRIDERVRTVDDLLKEEFDFSQDEVIITDGDTAEFPKTAEEAADRWRKRIKYDLLMLKDEKVEGQEARDRLARRYHSFAKRMQGTDSDELLQLFLTSITTSFDPHTTYMSPKSLDNFRIMMRLNLDGIGAALRMEDGYTIVSKVIPGGAAEKAAELKPEDRVVSVGQGEDGEMVDVTEMNLDDVVGLIRGKAGTVVRLGVIPAGGGEQKVYKITRAKIELSDSEARSVIFEEGKKANGQPYKVGVIDLPSFYMDMEAAQAGNENFKSTTRDMRLILEKFRKSGVDAVVLDLRRNGGGSLTEAINLTGLFIDEGPVVQVKDYDQRVRVYDDTEQGVAWDGPLVVLTSKFSASASEIFAGAIQDYDRGLVIGDSSTHGKGTVQSLLDLGSQMFKIPNPPNLGALKITIQQFYRPNGDSTQKRGVLADITLPSLTDHMDVSEADLDFAVEFDRVPAATYSKYDMRSPDVVGKLAEASKNRRESQKEFQKLKEDIAQYVELKERKTAPLNEEKFFAERKQFNANKEEEKQYEEQLNGRDEVVKRDYYFNEILNITVDYLNLIDNRRIAATVN
jgi:carboxyl-terminal processing protease